MQTPSILPFLLHLYKSIPDADSKLLLLNSVPCLATHPAAAVSMLGILRLLGTTPSLLALATRLMGRAWQLQDQLYPYLKDFLTRPLPTSMLPAAAREIQVARIAVIKDICRDRWEGVARGLGLFTPVWLLLIQGGTTWRGNAESHIQSPLLRLP